MSQTADLPEEEEAEGDLNGREPHSVEVHHEVHELLGVGGHQVHNLPHGARPPGRAVDHQRLGADRRDGLTPQHQLETQVNPSPPTTDTG